MDPPADYWHYRSPGILRWKILVEEYLEEVRSLRLFNIYSDIYPKWLTYMVDQAKAFFARQVQRWRSHPVLQIPCVAEQVVHFLHGTPRQYALIVATREEVIQALCAMYPRSRTAHWQLTRRQGLYEYLSTRTRLRNHLALVCFQMYEHGLNMHSLLADWQRCLHNYSNWFRENGHYAPWHWQVTPIGPIPIPIWT